MIFREARLDDISQILEVRRSVKENILSDPDLVTKEICEEFLTIRGKGWVCENDGQIAGFSIIDLKEHNVWALFVRPDREKEGIGRQLHDLMLHWYFSKTPADLWLGTMPNTRAEEFYHSCGWRKTGHRPNGEVRFELTYDAWTRVASRVPGGEFRNR